MKFYAHNFSLAKAAPGNASLFFPQNMKAKLANLLCSRALNIIFNGRYFYPDARIA